MARKLFVLVEIISLCSVYALSFSQQSHVTSPVDCHLQVPTRTCRNPELMLASSMNNQGFSSQPKKFNSHPGPCKSLDVNRREAAFAMLGGLWAVNAAPAWGEYGTDAKIQLPNPMEQMRDRATKQCLMESLGNRECLVYEDPDNKLYQNPDTKVLVERVEKAGEALATIPDLVESKNWIKVTGVLTGPMGTLANSMDLLSKASDNPSACAEKAKKVKTDLYGISGAVDRRNGNGALEYHKLATEHLVDYIKSL